MRDARTQHAGVIQIEKFAPRQTASACEFLDHHTSQVRGAPPFPDRPTVGRPVVNRPIQVQVLVGEPIHKRRDRLVARTRRLSTGRPEFESPSRHHRCTRSSIGLNTSLRIRRMQVRVLPCAPFCEQDSRFGLLARSGERVPAEATLLDQRVGEPGRPCLPWKQEISGSNPPTLTNCSWFAQRLRAAAFQAAGRVFKSSARASLQDGWPSGKAAQC